MDLFAIWVDAGGDGTREGFLEHLKTMWPERAAEIDANPLKYLSYYGFRAAPGGFPKAGGASGQWDIPEGTVFSTGAGGAEAGAAGGGEEVGVGSLLSGGGLGAGSTGGGAYGATTTYGAAQLPPGTTAEELGWTNPAEYFQRDPSLYGLKALEEGGYSYGPYASFLRSTMIPEAVDQFRLAQMAATASGGQSPSLDMMRRAMGGERFGGPGALEAIMASPLGRAYMQSPETASQAADVYGAYRASKPAAYGPFADYMNRQSSLDWNRYKAANIGQPEWAWLDYLRSRGY